MTVVICQSQLRYHYKVLEALVDPFSLELVGGWCGAEGKSTL